jgi:4-methyl-5(b-hydroxyethyl)-thiazole monophosphate biosynthesis
MPSVLIPLAPGFEEIEAVTLSDVFRRAAMTVVMAATLENPVRASRDVVVVADTMLDSALDRDYDLVVLPGGNKGADYLASDTRILNLLQKQAQKNGWIGAICAAPKVLLKAGLLEGKKATAFPGVLDGAKGVQMMHKAVVIDGRIVTSTGPGTAMDFALTFIELLEGKEKRLAVEMPLQRPEVL